MAEVLNFAHATRLKNSSSKKSFARASTRHSGNCVLQFRSGGAWQKIVQVQANTGLVLLDEAEEFRRLAEGAEALERWQNTNRLIQRQGTDFVECRKSRELYHHQSRDIASQLKRFKSKQLLIYIYSAAHQRRAACSAEPWRSWLHQVI